MLKLAAVLALALAGAIVAHPADYLPPAGNEPGAAQRHTEEAAVVREPAAPLTELFEQAVEEWIEALAAEPEFARWRDAQWERYPLGAGMRGWVVILSDQQGECGYLVISGYPDGQFQLAEYGAGPYPLFSEQTLNSSLALTEQPEGAIAYTGLYMERHYYSPLQHVWRVITADGELILDAKTGERFELRQQDGTAYGEETGYAETDEGGIGSLVNAGPYASLDAAAYTPEFDPYYDLGWIAEDGVNIKDLQQLQALLDQQTTLTFVSSAYGGQITTAYAVTGYHQWKGGPPYIALYNDFSGSRYVPAEYVMRTGEFHTAQMPSPIDE